MNIKSLKTVLLISLVSAFMGSCGLCNKRVVRVSKEEKKTLKYLKANDISLDELEQLNAPKDSEYNLAYCDSVGFSQVSLEEKRSLEYMEANNIGLSELKQMNTLAIGECNPVCCDSIEFCGISKGDVMKYIRNYRNTTWVESSQFFQDHDTLAIDIDHTMRMLANGQYGALGLNEDPFLDTNSFDARFMDIPIRQLENYLCFLRNSPETDSVNMCRFYYMKYDDDPKLGKYRNKHTLAMVPVHVPMNGTSSSSQSREITQSFERNKAQTVMPIFAIGTSECNKKGGNSNHNHLCPPFRNCSQNTMLYEVDND